jgi:hypothetical protein
VKAGVFFWHVCRPEPAISERSERRLPVRTGLSVQLLAAKKRNPCHIWSGAPLKKSHQRWVFFSGLHVGLSRRLVREADVDRRFDDKKHAQELAPSMRRGQ